MKKLLTFLIVAAISFGGIAIAQQGFLEFQGGTGETSYATGDILVATSSNDLDRLPVGSDGQVLKVSSGVPAWGTDTGGIENVVEDTTPQLGGELDVNSNDILLGQNNKLIGGNDQALWWNPDIWGFMFGYPSNGNASVDLTFPSSVFIESNTDLDGNGTWEPFIDLNSGGYVQIQSFNQGTAGNRYFDVRFTDGMRLTNSNTGPSAIIKSDNIATSDKTFQFPNTSGTLALDSDLTALTLTDLSDVDTDKSKTPADGDFLAFDGTDWNAETISSSPWTQSGDTVTYSGGTFPMAQVSGARATFRANTNSTSQQPKLQFSVNGTNITGITQDYSGGRMSFNNTSHAWQLNLEHDGDVGVGLGVGNDPTHQLDVGGDVNTSGNYLISGSQIDTDNVLEGTNLYYTEARVLSELLDANPAVFGNATTSALAVSGLTNCDTIDTDANGVLSCGTDAGSSGGISNVVEDTTPQLGGDLDGQSTYDLNNIVNAELEGYLDLTEIAVPANPAAGTIRIFAEDDGGFSTLHFDDASGEDFDLTRDSVIIVRNTTGSTITKGSVVYLNGSNGTLPTIAPADATNGTTMPSLGIVVADIANNSNGQILRAGILSGVDTSSYTDGQELFVSTTPGAFTTTEPTGTAVDQQIATVVKGGSVGAGIIFVNVGTENDPTLTQTFSNKTIDGDNNTLSNLDIGNEVDWAAAADVADRSASPALGDKLLIFESGVGMRKIDWDDLPGNETITLSGDVTGSGTTSIATSLSTGSVGDNEIDFTNVTLNDLIFDVGSVSKTEFGYLDGVTSAIQTQLNTKLENVVEDTTPQLGGNLDAQSNDITGVGDIVASTARFGGASALRSFNVFGTGLDGRLSIQGGSSSDNPGIEMTINGNTSRILARLGTVGTDGTEWQIYTEPDGGSITNFWTFGSDGDLNFNNSTTITGLADPTAAQEAATKAYVDTDEERIISTTIASTSPEFVSGGSLPAIMDKDGFTLTEYTCFVEGGTSVVVNLSDGTNDTETITCTTAGASDADVATNDTFTADERGYIEIGTITGDVNYLHFEAYADVTR